MVNPVSKVWFLFRHTLYIKIFCYCKQSTLKFYDTTLRVVRMFLVNEFIPLYTCMGYERNDQNWSFHFFNLKYSIKTCAQKNNLHNKLMMSTWSWDELVPIKKEKRLNKNKVSLEISWTAVFGETLNCASRSASIHIRPSHVKFFLIS